MRVGLQIPSFTWSNNVKQLAPKLAEIATTADEGGFYSLWAMDHFFQIEMIGPAENEMLESYGTLNYLAALTKRVKLGTLVTGGATPPCFPMRLSDETGETGNVGDRRDLSLPRHSHQDSDHAGCPLWRAGVSGHRGRVV